MKFTVLITKTENAEMEVEADDRRAARLIAREEINRRLSNGDDLSDMKWQRDGGIHVESLD
jgi:hypothetical protein